MPQTITLKGIDEVTIRVDPATGTPISAYARAVTQDQNGNDAGYRYHNIDLSDINFTDVFPVPPGKVSKRQVHDPVKNHQKEFVDLVAEKMRKDLGL